MLKTKGIKSVLKKWWKLEIVKDGDDFDYFKGNPENCIDAAIKASDLEDFK